MSLTFNKNKKIENFTFIIARKDDYKYGIIHGVDVSYKRNFNGADEISLKTYKNEKVNLTAWDRVNDYNILIVPELGDDGYFEMDVGLNEDDDGAYKTITGTSLAESELSHTKIYGYEVNTENEQTYDEDWGINGKVTLFIRDLSGYTPGTDEYNEMKHLSLIHRILDKVPNYTIGDVDATLYDLTDWYQFSWDDQDIYSVLTQDVAEQYHVWFEFNSRTRTISIHDLYSTCNNDNCSYRTKMLADRNITTRFRGDFHDKCPYCGSTNITKGYGKFTNIFVSRDNLANSATVTSNKDSLINCFKLKSGDEDMDAALANQNPNGSFYIYQFSDENKAEMPPDLVTVLENYNTEYNKYYNGDSVSGKGIYNFTSNEVNQYNALISAIQGKFTQEILDNFVNLKTQYIGYQSLASAYYSVQDLLGFYNDSMAPTPETNEESLADTKALLEVTDNLSPIAVTNPATATAAMIENGIVQSANCIINTASYTVTPNTTSWSPASTQAGTGTWRGTITIVSIEHKNTKYESANTVTTKSLTITVNGNVSLYVKQKIDKLISRKKAQVKPLTSLIDLKPLAGLVNVPILEDSTSAQEAFRQQLKYYSLDILIKIVGPCFQDVLSIVQENSNKINELYYDIYYTRLQMIESEIVTRTAQVELIEKILQKIEGYRSDTQEVLNFQNYLGETLYSLFCAYRREATYSNPNFISTDLSNSVIMRKAGEMIDYAQKELYKQSHLQYQITGNLNNLLAIPSFSSIFDDFEVGNWIKMSVDDKIYDLRLLSYQIDFDELQSIDVEFSTVEEIWSGSSDIQSVLKSAGSIAGSYSNTQSQVRNFSNQSLYVRDWVNKGMDATLTKFMDDGATQEIVYDSSGLYARGYEDISAGYLPQQLKINKNGIYITEDAWKTLSTGIGAFTYFDPETNKNVDAYGVIAKTVVGKLILGENLKIMNENNKFQINNNGLVLTNGKNTFTVNPNNNSKLLAISNTTGDVFWVDSNGMLHIKGDGSGLDISSNAQFSNYSTTTEMNASIKASVDGLSSTVSQTYETKTDANSKKTSLQSSINQTASQIRTDVSNTYETIENANSNYRSFSQSISTIDQKADGISLTVSQHTTSINTLTGKVDTNTENISAIDQKADGITASVSKIVDGKEVTAAKIAALINDAGSTVTINANHINLTAQNIADKINSSTVTISAGHITLEGIVTANNYFKINTDGSMETKNGKFSGSITTGSRTGSTAASGAYISSTGDFYSGTSNQNIIYANGNFQLGGSNGMKYQNGKVSFGSDCVITFDTSGIPTDISDLTDKQGKILTSSQVTTITSNTIKTTNVVAQNLHVNSVNIDGTITANYIDANSCTIGNWSIDGTGLYYGSSSNKSYIYPYGIYLKDGSDYAYFRLIPDHEIGMSGSCYMSVTSSLDIGAGSGFTITGDASSTIKATSGDLTVEGKSFLYLNGTYVDIVASSTIKIQSAATTVVPSHESECFRPSTDGSCNLGNSGHKWSTVYASSATINTSDKKDKDILGSIDYAKNLIMSLSPTRYMWKNGDHRRTRMGFIAQDVASTCKDLGENLALVTASYRADPELVEDIDLIKPYYGEEVDDEELSWGLAYTELIAPMVAVIQQQQKQIEQLTNQVNALINKQQEIKEN